MIIASQGGLITPSTWGIDVSDFCEICLVVGDKPQTGIFRPRRCCDITNVLNDGDCPLYGKEKSHNEAKSSGLNRNRLPRARIDSTSARKLTNPCLRVTIEIASSYQRARASFSNQKWWTIRVHSFHCLFVILDIPRPNEMTVSFNLLG